MSKRAYTQSTARLSGPWTVHGPLPRATGRTAQSCTRFSDQNVCVTSRSMWEKPIRPDLSRPTPKNTILNLLFACSVCSSVGIQVSSVSFGLFSCTRPWQAVIQTKKSVPCGGIALAQKFILLSFSSERKKLCIYFRPIFLAVNV